MDGTNIENGRDGERGDPATYARAEPEAGRGSTMDPRDAVLTLAPSSVFRKLLAIIATLLILSIIGQAVVMYSRDFPLRDTLANLFFVDWERSVPTLFSTLMLVASALLLGLIAHARSGQANGRHWLALSIVFSLLALDEFASLHEQSIERVRSFLDIRGGVFFFAWVIPAMVVVAAFGIAFIPFLRRLPRPTQRGFVLAALLYIGGAIGVEMVGSAYFDSHGRTQDMTYALIVAVEEGLEMIGIAVFVCTLLFYIAVALPGVGWRVRVVKSPKGFLDKA